MVAACALAQLLAFSWRPALPLILSVAVHLGLALGWTLAATSLHGTRRTSRFVVIMLGATLFELTWLIVLQNVAWFDPKALR